jgi:hypothetical protein
MTTFSFPRYLATLMLCGLLAQPALADRRDNGFTLGAEAWHPPARQFRDFDGGYREARRERFGRPNRPAWNSGYWYNGHHEGRLGWWWVVGSLWYFYPQPVDPYPAYPYESNVTIIQTPPAQPTQPMPPVQPTQPNIQTTPSAPNNNVWYYCADADEYYPYVRECPAGWRTVPAKPADLRR